MDPTKNRFFNDVESFVKWSGGDHAIKKILIANNGIGAIKAIRSIRRWCFETFGNERAVEFVVMASPEDFNANAEYIRAADYVVDVPGGTNNNNYANINLICEIADRYKVDAVMPMWGHASENPLLPTSLLALSHRCSFIGPPAEPMYALGDKIGSTIIAQSAGVPVIGWNGDDLRINYRETGMPQDIYDLANVVTAEDALACALRIGFPVMIKASEGGGGKGIRKVHRAEDVLNSYRQVQGEIPGSPIFVMKMASKARHLEVQLLADKYGEAVALSGRDCSVQRRHQKIIEEGPPTAAPPSVFKKMEQAAVALAKTVGYCNCGTVEYLYMEETQTFAFLELNPRLQVEHPVTENILGLNLPACQLQVAMGIPLHRIGDVRKLYGRHRFGKDTIDFEFSERCAPPRHCIAVRVTAENPESAFQPTSGTIKELQFLSAIDVWGYFSINSSGNIHEFADSQFGHIFASGPDRESARKAMVVALKEMSIRGEIRTTMEYITKLLQSNDFSDNKIDTDWLDGRIARHKQLAIEDHAKYCPPHSLIALCGAALQGFKHFKACGDDFVNMLKIGQIPSKEILSNTVSIDLIYENVKYSTVCIQSGPNDLIIECNNSKQGVSIKTLADGGYLLNLEGKSHLLYSRDESGGSLRMTLDGHTCIFTPEYDPTRLTSAVAGKIARLLVSDGDHVNAGDPYVEVEVMKMYMPIKAPESGTVHFQMSEGAALKPGDLIAVAKLDDPDKVVKAQKFNGTLTESDSFDISSEVYMPPHLVMREALGILEKTLAGYHISAADIEKAMDTYLKSLRNSLLPVYELEEAMAVLRGRIDSNVAAAVVKANCDYRESIVAGLSVDYPSTTILTSLQLYTVSLSGAQRTAFTNQTATVWTVAEQYQYNLDTRILAVFQRFLESFLAVEKLFDNMSFTDVVSDLRKEHSADLTKVLSLCRSHVNLKARTALISRVLEEMKMLQISPTIQRPASAKGIPVRNEINLRNLKIRLGDIANLRTETYSHVSFKANLVLMKQYSLKPEQRRQSLHDVITSALLTGDSVGCGDRKDIMKKFIESNLVFRDLLIEQLHHDKDYQIAALELYLMRIYQITHSIQNMVCGTLSGNSDGHLNPWIKFEFKTKAISLINDVKDSSKSYDDLTSLIQGSPRSEIDDYRHPVVAGTRFGIIAAAETFDQLVNNFSLIIGKISNEVDKKEAVNAVHIVIMNPVLASSDDETSMIFSKFLQGQANNLKDRGIRRVTFFTAQPDKKEISAPNPGGIFTFRINSNYEEDRLHRHIEAPHAYHLDLPRLSLYNVQLDAVQTSSGNVFIYKASPKAGKGSNRNFVRLVSFTGDVNNSDVESLFVEALDHLGLTVIQDVSVSGSRSPSAGNHIFFNIVAPDSVIQPVFYENELQRICKKYWYKMVRLRIATVELKLSCKIKADSESIYVRFVASNPTGFVLNIDKYYEAFIDGAAVFKNIGSQPGPLDCQLISTPYPIIQAFEDKRAEASASSDTLYVYDWPILFENGALQQWERYAEERPSYKVLIPEVIFSCKELVMFDSRTNQPFTKGWTAKDAEEYGTVKPIDREPGLNDVGMVAWLATFCTPESPEGREIVIICNDITFQAGSFGTKEDILFFKASQYARERGIPRLFLAANSGARIGMAQSLKDQFDICWSDANDPSKGFKYIYLSKEKYGQLLAKFGDVSKLPVICNLIQGPSGDERYMITDIIGEESDLGVENLMGSGLIAGETSRAYDDIFTLTLVVGRTVGIGAYLVRLGQRTIQKKNSCPIILTGYQALNKLMGREIYTTNDQLGGPMIMFPNGVSHVLAETHMDSVLKALNWLSYIPARKGASLPVRDIQGIDTIDRSITFMPLRSPYDPRLLLCGAGTDDNWQSGFLDKNSFVETLGGWAKTVVTGRGRLGGIPIGVIMTENRTAEATKPADPADMTSQEKLVQQAGGVWFPDSAYKTAQALRDFNREGLPCMVFANWRGFSGGQRDMFDEVLKFGSMIVDALVAYQQPLFVYIPPFAELRGGAWVVVDSTINSDVMEFYAAEDSRGGVLEAAGAASIKFRDRDIIATAHRVDHVLIRLDTELASTKDAAKVAELNKQMKLREKMIFGVYQQVAVHFADLHDTPGRMKSKGVIKKQVDWTASRTFFYWRLRRRLFEFSIAKTISSMSSNTPKIGYRQEFIKELQSFYVTKGGDLKQWDDDKIVVGWLQANEKSVLAFLNQKKQVALSSALADKLIEVSKLGPDSLSVLKHALASIPDDVKESLVAAMK